MSDEQTEATVTTKQQLVVNVSEEQKAELKDLKTKYNLTDKGVITLLLEVAYNNQKGLTDVDGEAVEVDTFAVIVDALGLAKKTKVEKPVLTDEEKAAAKAAKKQERLQKKLAELTAQLAAEVNPVDEPETVVEIGV